MPRPTSDQLRPWTKRTKVIDDELMRCIAEQNGELTNQRTELVRLTGFSAAIFGTAIALSHGKLVILWAFIAVGFVVMLFSGGLAFTRYRLVRERGSKAVAFAWSLEVPVRRQLTDRLLSEFLANRVEVSRINIEHAGTRDWLIWLARWIVVSSLILLGIIGYLEAQPAKHERPRAGYREAAAYVRTTRSGAASREDRRDRAK